MRGELAEAQLSQYSANGFLLITEALDAGEVEEIKAAAEGLCAIDSPARTMEPDGVTVRAVHGCHATSDVFAELVRDPRLLLPARQIVGGDVYIHQSKVNAKRALVGDVWQWHQDFVFWQREDGMREPAVVNVAVLVDEATVVNGPLLLIPGSHRKDGIDTVALTSEESEKGWSSHLAADLEYTVGSPDLRRLTANADIFPAVGPAGSLLLFDSRIVHGSGVNMSPLDRRMAIFTYNSISNIPVPVESARPEFLSARNVEPLKLLEKLDR